ncbi:MAG TPA: iron-containing alcohol dehydrogenase [Smithellaceae bacterium]|nr:iron-containing alcohol dehydrogenase [Smithellaceae bacterium]HQM45242.1 iron-containing alcohol dehydrogenase [Smithellaceae bacterium]
MDIINHLDLAGLPKIIFGSGVFDKIHDIINDYGGHALVITGVESLQKSGFWTPFTTELNRANMRCKAISVRGEPTVKAIDEIVSKYRQSAFSVVVAIGGGSVLDCGKAVSAMLVMTGSVRDYLEDVGDRKPSGKKLPFIAVPTTAGTGSEATKNAVLSDRKQGFKKSLRHDAYVPDIALVDPKLTLTLPLSLTVSCGLDAISQLIESYTSTKADESTDALALKALALASESLMPLAHGQGDDLKLREKMSFASLVSGITLSRAGLGAVHGIAGPLGGLCAVPHGVACGKLLFPVMAFVIKKILDDKNLVATKRFAGIGKVFMGEKCDANHDDSFYCKHFLDVLRDWSQTLRLPPFSAFGMTSEVMSQTMLLANCKNSPAVLSPGEIKVVLESVR